MRPAPTRRRSPGACDGCNGASGFRRTRECEIATGDGYRRRRERLTCDGRRLRLAVVHVIGGELRDPRRDRAPARLVGVRQQAGEAPTQDDAVGGAEAGAELLDQRDDLRSLAGSRSLGLRRWLCPARWHRYTTSGDELHKQYSGYSITRRPSQSGEGVSADTANRLPMRLVLAAQVVHPG